MIALPFLIGAAIAGGAFTLGASAIIIMSAFTIGTLLGEYLFPAKMNVHQMKPASLSDFSYNQANEGAPVPLIYGTVKIAGNIVWYGDLKTIKQTQSVGGKGLGGKNVTTGYKYYLDVWIILGIGQLSIGDTYVNGNKKQIILGILENNNLSSSWEAGYEIFNDGTTDLYPTIPGIYASPLHGIAHIFYKDFYIGENTTVIPTINYVLTRTLGTEIDYANMATGTNPAAIIYDILVNNIGISSANIDITSFNTAADIYNTNGTGLNIVLTSQRTGDKLIKYVMQFVNSSCYKDVSTGQYVITVLE